MNTALIISTLVGVAIIKAVKNKVAQLNADFAYYKATSRTPATHTMTYFVDDIAAACADDQRIEDEWENEYWRQELDDYRRVAQASAAYINADTDTAMTAAWLVLRNAVDTCKAEL